MRSPVIGLFQLSPERSHGRSEVSELLDMSLGQRVKLLRSQRRERDPDDAAATAVRVTRALDESVGDRPVDQFNRAVMTQDQIPGHLSDARTRGVRVAPDSQQQLVLGRGQARGPGLLIAPAQEAPQPGAQLEEVLEVGLPQMFIVYRYRGTILPSKRGGSR